MSSPRLCDVIVVEADLTPPLSFVWFIVDFRDRDIRWAELEDAGSSYRRLYSLSIKQGT